MLVSVFFKLDPDYMRFDYILNTRFKKIARRLFALYFLLFTGPALAIVNVENIRVKEPEEGFSGNLAAGIDLESGNTNRSRIALGARTQWKRGYVLDFIVFNYDYGESAGTTDVNKSFIHGRHVVTMSPRWAWEAYGQVQQDEFRRLNFRGLVGGGLRNTLYRSGDQTAVYLGFGSLFENEELDDNSVDQTVRGSFYLSIKHEVRKDVNLMSTTYLQPSIERFGNFRASEQAAITVGLTNTLDLKLALDISHDSEPPAGVERTDTKFTTGLAYRF
jgi:putative salt-induced outer membrane protein YdiY